MLNLSLGLSLGSYATLNKGARYESEALALFERMTVAPTAGRKKLISDMIKALKDADVWLKLDALYLLAAHDGQAARLNLIGDLFNLTAVAAPAFTPDRGYQGDGSSSYLETGFSPTSAASPKFLQDSGHLSLWSRTAALGIGVDMGNSNSLILTAQATTENFAHRVNSGSSGAVTNTDGAGFFVSSRTGATALENVGYRDGAAVSPQSALSTAVASGTIRILGRSGSVSFSARQASAASIGAGLSSQNVTDLYNVLNTYLAAVGAA